MQNSRIDRARRGSSRLPVLLSLLVLLGGGVLAYRHFFNRPGESAVKLVPADALMVATLDTSPSPQQVVTFKRIADALKRENLDKDLNKTFASLGLGANGSPVLDEIRPFWKNSFAFAGLPNPSNPTGSDPDFVLLASVSDTGSVRDILAKSGQATENNGLTSYFLKSDNTYAAIISDYVVASNKPGPLERIQAVYKGETQSVAAQPDYLEARRALPPDANLMLFVSPATWNHLQASNGMSLTAATNTVFQSAHWFALGMTIRDQGIEFITQTPLFAPKGVTLPAPMAAIRPDLMHHLPAGAYGLMTLSQPGRYWDWFQVGGLQNADFKHSLDDGVASFEHETGMSVPNDLLPGLQGDLTLAVYPEGDPSTPTGIEGLIVIDDANGADPARLADKIRAYVERKSAENGKEGLRFVSTQRNGATVWTLDPHSEEQIHRSLSSSPGSGPGLTTASASETNGFHTSAIGGNGPAGVSVSANAPSSPEGQARDMLRKKTVAYAQIGSTVLMASSQAMLDRGIAAYQSGTGSLADDPHYAKMVHASLPGAQSALLVSTTQILEALRPSLERSMRGSNSGITSDDILMLFGGPEAGLVATARYEGHTAITTLLLPLDFDKAIHMIGVTKKQSVGPGSNNPNLQ